MKQSMYDFYDANGMKVASGSRPQVCKQLYCQTGNLSYLIKSGAYLVVRRTAELVYRLENTDGTVTYGTAGEIRQILGSGIEISTLARECRHDRGYWYRKKWQLTETAKWIDTGESEILAEPDGDQHRYADCPPCGEVECQANREGRCSCLSDVDFGGRPCPFFRERCFDDPKQFDREYD